eukprot:TRINITY_DN28054_c0_g3_i2.p1 TRINITY_DN28054_c0_g3~~TRINITY_DN28054_c0_g3_i2.p1  ORF type:complete len:721 (+),score=140.41 TRINITY_DN28054_c0_g3_i2:81-2243(+)
MSETEKQDNNNNDNGNIHAEILKIMTDKTLTDEQKAEKRKELMAKQWGHLMDEGDEEGGAGAGCSRDQTAGGDQKENQKLDDELNCVICLNCCQKPVTAACQHSFCLRCFKRWAQQDRNCNCPTCRAPIARDLINNPRINTILAMAIRFGKQGQHDKKRTMQREYKQLKDNKADRPDKAYQTDRAVKTGMANAASGRMMVQMKNHHFGHITAEMDTTRGLGVRVGDWWKYRLDAYQWGVHMNHVGGISGQSGLGAQSVVISGGYEDDRDEGDWFLYTGSGGRDLSGNKRTNKKQSFDQEFALYNESLRQSCLKGLPVRVVRSVKEKRSAYAPPQETPIRYDGIYRVMACWRKAGAQGLLMCRYLFVRADNEAAPWAEDEGADRPMQQVPEDAQKEMDEAAESKVYTPQGQPYWDYDADQQQWAWTRDPPAMAANYGKKSAAKPAAKQRMVKVNLKNFSCGLCKETLNGPIVTPCGHNFCKDCISNKYDGIADVSVPQVGRALRGRKIVKPCPTCQKDLTEFLKNLQVNRDLERLIQKIKENQGVGEVLEELDTNQVIVQGEDKNEKKSPQKESPKHKSKQKSPQKDPVKVPIVEKLAVQDDEEQGNNQSGSLNADTKVEIKEGNDRSGSSGAETKVEIQEQQLPLEELREQQVKELQETFPMFEQEIIKVILEDNDGDAGAVGAILKRMKNQQKYQNRATKTDPKQKKTRGVLVACIMKV